MNIQTVTSPSFRRYGRLLPWAVPDLLKRLEKTPVPEGVAYEPSVSELEVCREFRQLQDEGFGGLPIQIGYCNGHNQTLEAVEYHRSSEINIPLTEAVLILGSQQEIGDDFSYDVNRMEVFAVPAGAVVELYATTLHYAPCGQAGKGFQVAIVLPRGTNLEGPGREGGGPERRLLEARNKWLLTWEHSALAQAGAWPGLRGEVPQVK